MLENPYRCWLAVMVVVTAIGFPIVGYTSEFTGDQWIGWFQAIGSVEAIIASILIAQADHWDDRRKDRELNDVERHALVLELVPQLTELDAWLRKTTTKLQRYLDVGGTAKRVPFSEFYHPIPPVLQTESRRLLLLGRRSGRRAIDIREWLSQSNDRVKSKGTGTFVAGGPQAQEPPISIKRTFKALTQLSETTKALLDDLKRLHGRLFPLPVEAEEDDAPEQ